jgi:hypothetical protein
VEDLAHDEVADIDAWMAEVDQQSSSEDTERNTRDGRPVVTTVSSQTPADERSDDGGGDGECVEDVAGFGDAELVDDLQVGIVIRIPGTGEGG